MWSRGDQPSSRPRERILGGWNVGDGRRAASAVFTRSVGEQSLSIHLSGVSLWWVPEFVDLVWGFVLPERITDASCERPALDSAPCTACGDDIRDDALAELVVGDAADDRLSNTGIVSENVLDLSRIDAIARRNDHAVRAPLMVEIAVLVTVSPIAGVEQRFVR